MAARLVEDLGAGDVGRHQVRRELDALEGQVEDVGEGLDEPGLGEPRHPRDQAVPAGEQGGQHEVDGLVLADDHAPELSQDALAAAREVPRPGRRRLGRGREAGRRSGSGRDGVDALGRYVSHALRPACQWVSA